RWHCPAQSSPLVPLRPFMIVAAEARSRVQRNADLTSRASSAQQRPRAVDLRALQQYVVPVTRQARDGWVSTGVRRPVHAALGDAFLRFEDLANYDPATGVRVEDPYYRAPEMNVIS